ncbi:MAG TPA: TonB family protein [Victivallales bacterium]|nr:TonB family protein [Victivallales bacterium]HPO90253.1 TonB family protein [Victivallales bacterium]
MKISDKTAYNLFLKSADSSRELSLSKEIQRNVFYFVIIGHIFFFLLPFFFDYLQKFFKPKREPIITVKLIEESKNIEKASNLFEEKKTPPTPPTPKPPVHNQIEKPEPKVEEPKPLKKIVEKPVQKQKKEIKKPLKPIEKPKWTPIDPKNITKSKEIVKREAQKIPTIDPNKIKESLTKINNQIKTSSRQSPQNSNSQVLDYYDKVSAYLYDLWAQPSKTELKGERPFVLVTISVDVSGRVLHSSIKSRSNNTAMDASIEDLLKKLTNLPPPPSGPMDFDVSLEISD